MSVCPLDSFCLLVISACQSSGGMWLRASSAGRSLLSEPCNDVRKAFLCAFAARWQDQPIALHVNVHGRIDKREEVMTRTNTRETWFLSGFAPTEEGCHRFIRAKVHLVQELAIDLMEFRIVLLAFLKRGFCFFPPRPFLTIP